MNRLRRLVDIRDLFAFGGLGLLGRGLWLYEPWVAYAVCGGLLFLMAFIPAPGPKARQ